VLGPGGVEQALEVYPIPYLLNPWFEREPGTSPWSVSRPG